MGRRIAAGFNARARRPRGIIETEKYCPECSATRLESYRHGNEQLDLCRSCGGLWFEKANVDNIVTSHDTRIAEYNYVEHLGERQEPAEKSCPECRVALARYHLLEDFHLEIDVCRRCHGAWVEAHEVDRVARSSQLRRALARINTDVNWKTWVFHFLSGGLPVEYNMRPRRIPWLTYAFILINCTIFALYGFGSEAQLEQTLRTFGATPSRLADGEAPWTLVTAIFFHTGLGHLLGNMFFFWIVGDNVEDAVGGKTFVGAMLACGVFAAGCDIAARLYLEVGLDIPGAGFSGALAGFFAMYMMWFPWARLSGIPIPYVSLIPIKLPVYVFFGLWVVLQITPLVGGNLFAHVSGFVAGLCIGIFMRRTVWRENPLMRYLAGPEAQLSR